ncbi:MAG: 1-deoxy-D-xylulose-5-phosphate reductoisomerase [Halocynthiibacter sp.]|jgi:1-deoxy-D-xylulose-5-phosphate reductoisomerase
MRKISIFGATGSIGQSTLDLIRRDAQAYDVVALTGGQNIAQLARDAIEFGADIAVTADEGKLSALREALAGSGVKAAAGQGAITDAASRPADWAMSAIVGAAGLAPGLEALKQGATLALANKESMVTAGPLMRAAAAKHGAALLPVDSEHSAVMQAMEGGRLEEIESVTITASGGPFRTWDQAALEKATLKQAGNHPTWDMGQRITIDSASMFNKALEVIEAKELFALTSDQIKVLVHPESIIHALVAYSDGGVMAHMGAPDMRHAIGYALHHPARRALPVARLDLAAIGALTFEEPDANRFPALRLAREVMSEGGMAGAAFNAAKERALDHFIAGEIGFCDMARVVEDVLTQMCGQDSASGGHIHAAFTYDNVIETDRIARLKASESVARRRAEKD